MDHVLRYAEERQCYVGAFDTPDLEALTAIIRATERREEPAITQHARPHECEMPIRIVDPTAARTAKEARVPICVVPDHGEDLDYVRKALGLDSSAVMYDGFSLAYEENVAMIRKIVAMAKVCNADVEAEIGIVTGHEGKASAINDVSDAYTDPELAARYVKDTGIDALATSVGTIHGSYVTRPKLDFDWIARIKELTGLPLVMYGGSDISVADIQKATRCGIRKINYFSHMSNVGVKAVKKLLEEKEVRHFHDLASATVDVMEQDALNTMSMFALEQI